MLLFRGNLVEVLQLAHRVYRRRLRNSWLCQPSGGGIEYDEVSTSSCAQLVVRLYKTCERVLPPDNWVDIIDTPADTVKYSPQAKLLMRRYFLFGVL